MIPLLVVLLLVPFPDEPIPPAPPPPTASHNVAGLFSYEDYPAKALENGWEGSVIVKVRVGTNGRVRSCRIVKSSGHVPLDIKTCEIVLLRAKFSPARDSNGNPVEDDVELPRISWMIADEPTPKPEPAAQ